MSSSVLSPFRPGIILFPHSRSFEFRLEVNRSNILPIAGRWYPLLALFCYIPSIRMRTAPYPMPDQSRNALVCLVKEL